MNKTLSTAIVSALLAMGGTLACADVAIAQTRAVQSYQIPAGDLDKALRSYASQSSLQLIYSAESVRGKKSAGLSGEHTPAEALQRLLSGSGLQAETINAKTIALKPVAPPKPPAEKKPPPKTSQASPKDDDVVGMPAIMVRGTKTLNMDITRTEDDPQPYVVFDREQIENSGATSLEQFLQQRLTMNTSQVNDGSGIATSQITLRGLSAAQTLILVDGHRVSSVAFSANFQGGLSQADISGLPLGAIERIEVLPTTASGIYGGSATGGVINIILRRDYTGGEITFTYDNTFNTDTAGGKVNLTFGHSFNQGKTSLMVTANYSEANDLLLGNRNLAQRGREAIWTNNPGFFTGPTGLPPLGATPNITSVDGSNLVLRDGTPLNSVFTSVPEGYAGPGSDGGAALVDNAGRYNWTLANTTQRDQSSGGSKQALYTRPRVKSGAVSIRHRVNDFLDVFTDLSSSQSVNKFRQSLVSSTYRIPRLSPTNPFSQDILVSVPLLDSDVGYSTAIDHNRALVGLVGRLGKKWLFGMDYTFDKTAIATSFPARAPAFSNAVTAGNVQVIQDTSEFSISLAPYIVDGGHTSPFKSSMSDINLRVSGPVGNTPGGTPVISASVSRRHENVSDAFWIDTAATSRFFPKRSQIVASGYMELWLPIFSERNSRPGMQALELQLAARYDSYTSWSGEQLLFSGDIPPSLLDITRAKNTFESTDPTIAVRWKPWQSLAIRASYGAGFVPPGLNQIVPTVSSAGIIAFRDPLRGNTPAGPFTYTTGGAQNLKPEQSKSLSAGLIITPVAWPDVRLSIDYTRIEKVDVIAGHPGFFQGLINDESLFQDRIVRGPQRPDDPQEWAGPIIHIDNSLMNLASAKLEAWDVQLDARKKFTQFGTLDFFFAGTWQPHYKTRTISNLPEVENAGIGASSPLKIKLNAGVTWTHAAWRAGWIIQHFDEYKVSVFDQYIANQGRDGIVPSQTYNDIFIKYDLPTARDWLSGIEVQLGIRNIFGKKPPLDVLNDAGFYSGFGDPRLSSYYLTVEAAF